MNVERRLRNAIESFAVDLDALVRQAAFEAVASAFDGGGGSAVREVRGARAAASTGGKRTAAELDALCEALARTVDEHPGERIEQLAVLMAVPSRSLALPTRKLLATRRIKKKGEKRATTYFAR